MMEVKFNELALGEVIYDFKRVYDNFSKPRIEFVDSEGIIWHRYANDVKKYKIRKLEYIGTIQKKLIGDYVIKTYSDPDDSEGGHLYFFKADDHDEDILEFLERDQEDFYLTKEEAQEALDEYIKNN